MREFYHTLPPRYRPKVFGMTASPIWNINNPLQSLKDLEFNMLSKVIGVRQNLDELAENSPRPNEVLLSKFYFFKIKTKKINHRPLFSTLRRPVILLIPIHCGKNLGTTVSTTIQISSQIKSKLDTWSLYMNWVRLPRTST